MSETIHALYSASSLDRLAICPISARLSEGVVIPSGEAAQRGTRIHALAEGLLNNEPAIEYDQEEMNIAQDYVSFVKGMLGDGDLYVEVNLENALQKYNPNFGGTADAVIRNNATLDVIDLKTGTAHVTAKENRQLLTYGLGALGTLGWEGVETVRLHIWQPGNTHSVEYPIARLHSWEIELTEIGERADDPFAKAVPTAKGCYYCKGKAKCDALRDKAMEAAKQDFSGNNLEKLLDDAELVGLWVDAVKSQGKTLLADGADGGHWGLKPGRKMTSWTDIFAVEDYFAGNPKAFEIKSIAQIKKLGLEIPEQFIEVKESAPSLTRKSGELG